MFDGLLDVIEDDTRILNYKICFNFSGASFNPKTDCWDKKDFISISVYEEHIYGMRYELKNTRDFLVEGLAPLLGFNWVSGWYKRKDWGYENRGGCINFGEENYEKETTRIIDFLMKNKFKKVSDDHVIREFKTKKELNDFIQLIYNY